MSIERGLFVLLMGLAALGPISTDLYLPSLPSIGRNFGADQAAVQATLSVFMAGFAVSVLICGPLSDRYGRQPVLIGALILFSLTSLACALSPTIETLTFMRLCQAFAAGSGPVITRAIIRDTHSRDDSIRMISYLSAGVAVSPLIGPFIGGFLETWINWRANFFFLAVYAAAGTIWVWTTLPETRPASTLPRGHFFSFMRDYAAFLRNRHYVGYMFCSTFAFCGMFSFISGSSFVFISVLDVPPKYFGLCFSFFVLGFMSGAYLGGRLTKSWKANKIILVGIIISLAAGVSLIVASFAGGSILFLLLPLYPYMLGMGLITPLANASAIAPYPQSAGAAGGLMNFVSIIFAATTGALLGHTPLTSAAPMAAFMTGSTILVVLSYYIFIREKSNSPHSFATK